MTVTVLTDQRHTQKSQQNGYSMIFFSGGFVTWVSVKLSKLALPYVQSQTLLVEKEENPMGESLCEASPLDLRSGEREWTEIGRSLTMRSRPTEFIFGKE